MSKRKIKKILELKEFTKDQLELSFQKSKDEFESEYEKLDYSVRTFERFLADFGRRQEEGDMHTQELDFFYNYFSYLTKQIEHQKQSVSERLTEVEQKKKTMINAYKEQKLFEIYYDKILHEEKRTIIKTEQKDADFHFISEKLRK